MITIRKSADRGHADHGWLDTYHSFSFAGYMDPRHMGFRSLRVLNEDRVAPGAGFAPHGHRDMEIISYVLSGQLGHQDSMGHGAVLEAGDVQHMTAGSGIRHSEKNASHSDELHFLQIWIEPEAKGLEPGFEDRTFPAEEKRNVLRRLASPNGDDGSMSIRQDVSLYASLLDAGRTVEHQLEPGRHAWVQVARGEITVHGETLTAGDGAAISDQSDLTIAAVEDSELLLFDLA